MNEFLRSTGSISLAASALLTGCVSNTNPPQRQCFQGQPVVIPPSDNSPPTLVATLTLPNGPTVSLLTSNAPQTITSSTSGQVTVMARAIDPQGVKDIQIWAAEKICTVSGDSVTCAGPGLLGSPSASNPDTGAIGATGCTERLTLQNLSILKNASREVSHELTITGINFGGQKVNLGTVIVRVQ